MSCGTRAVAVAGTTLVLDAERALYWPEQQALIVADLHLGKGQVLREHGLAMPAGGSSASLARLDGLLARHRSQTLWVLGDLIHGRTRANAAWIEAFVQWRARHPQLAVRLVRGNHDRHVNCANLGIEDVGDAVRLGPLDLVHDHAPNGAGFALSGHLHPGVILRERHAPSVRLPAFWLAQQHLVLPAFGALTGLAPYPAPPGTTIYACAGDALIEVSRARRTRSG